MYIVNHTMVLHNYTMIYSNTMYINDGCLMFDVWSISVDVLTNVCIYIYIHIVYGWSRQWQFLQGFDHGACLGANLQQRNGSGFLERLLQQVDRLKLLRLPWIAHAACTQGNHRWRHATSEHRYGMMIWVHKGPIYIYYIYTYIISIYSIHLSFRAPGPLWLPPGRPVTPQWSCCFWPFHLRATWSLPTRHCLGEPWRQKGDRGHRKEAVI